VTVICSSEVRTADGDRDLPYALRRLHYRNRIQHNIGARWTIGREMLRHRVTIVNGLDTLVHPVAKRLRRPYILKVPGDSAWQAARNAGATSLDIDRFQTESPPRFDPAKAQRSRIARDAAHVVTPSNYLKGMVVGWGVSADAITVIPNGVDLDRFAPRTARRSATDPFRLLFVGRLTNWKGVETALLASVGLPEVEFTVIGEGPSYPQLVELAAQLGLSPRVRFLGRQSQQEVADAMSRSHALVLTSLYEGMSHTLQEAMATGLPCIASSRGGNDEVIQSGTDGLLVEPQDVAALTAAIRGLLDDEDRRLKMAEAARATSTRFSIERTLDGFMALIERLSDCRAQ
jgi:glycosyltransferase involved in cell wall biosynthesis